MFTFLFGSAIVNPSAPQAARHQGGFDPIRVGSAEISSCAIHPRRKRRGIAGVWIKGMGIKRKGIDSRTRIKSGKQGAEKSFGFKARGSFEMRVVSGKEKAGRGAGASTEPATGRADLEARLTHSGREKLLEDMMLEILQRKPFSTIDLINEIMFLRPGTTKQGVYRVIRKLKREEKVVVYGKVVSLNLHWLKKMSDFFSLAQFYYLPEGFGSQNFFDVREGDKIIYFFKNLNLLDSFCTHVIYMLTEVSDPKEPIFVYNPHEWFAYARREVERGLLKALEEKNKKILVISTHDDPLDQELKKRFRDSLVQYHIAEKSISIKENYYFNVFDDYILEIFFDSRIISAIKEFFRKAKIFDEGAERGLMGIVSREGRNKVVISKDKKKADKYKKFFARYFFIEK
ncbi:hypothetical protein HYV91_02080 [Candidatus Wolfebacteria bacterium]|nr:hypothetical protein [Candidatus Wolfebacteria bacterium]